MASHLSWLANLLFLLLILAQTPTSNTRPARAAPASDIIAGNEFLKLFLEHDETQRELHSGENAERGRMLRGTSALDSSESSSSTSRSAAKEKRVTRSNQHESTAADANTQSNGQELSNRGVAARSIQYKSHNKPHNEATATVATVTSTTKAAAAERKQVVKLVKSGGKIVFLEEYDDNDAIVDAEARDIDLKKENKRAHGKQAAAKESAAAAAAEQQARMQYKSNPSDEIKVIAVSVSSSSKRGGYSRKSNPISNKVDTAMSKQGNKLTATSQTSMQQQQQSDGSASAMKLTLTTTPPTAPMTASDSASMDDFVNRSHKSEFSIEEAEPLTMSPQKQRVANAAATNSQAARVSIARSLHMPHAVSGRAVQNSNTKLDAGDSENSASTNIQNVLAVPLLQAASTRTASVNVPAVFHGRNVTSTHINHNHKSAPASAHMNDAIMLDTSAAATTTDVEEKLLPFQTVIYHNTKEGHGPQSRSISYSSLSQNVEDLQKWRQTGILAEAQRNVSESLKPIPRAQLLPHTSEPAKFYSVPSKMYSEPSKFYSEQAKVYGEPAKVYGEPEKFYSEPAKVYGQPSKFYSEPSKVYSQPAQVYSEPAKTYWSPSTTTTTTSTTTSTTTVRTPTHTTTSTTTTTMRPFGGFMPSRRPAIVSRIAFGEAQTSTSAPRVVEEHAPVTTSVFTNTQQQQQQQQQNHNVHHTRFPPHPYSTSTHSHNAHSSNIGSAPAHSQFHTSFNPSQPSTQSQSPLHSSQSQPRRVLFNLDKLPYDLLNAPVQSSQHLLDPDFPHSPPAAVTYSSARQRQCLESAFSVSQHQRQHSSLSDQHSNQNAKGLPNRDLVKCVSIYNQLPAASSTASTESGHNDSGGGDDDDDDDNNNNNDDLYKPTPEQNYEIEESVSVMTNGRAHGVQGNSAATTTTATPYAMRTTKYPNRGSIHHQQQQQQQHYLGNANTNVNADNNNYDDNIGGDPGGFDGGDGDAGGADEEGIDGDGNKSGGNADEDAKVAYVVEGRNYRKYRVEEKTDDGFIVGEYGVVDHNDGNLRGVRYTADSTINRSLIQKALLTFLKLK